MSAVDALNSLELDEEKFIALLGNLIGESQGLQNTGVGTAHVPREDNAIRHVLEVLKPYRKESGGVLEVEHVTYAEGRGNVIIRYPGSGPNASADKQLTFAGSHLDVVPANPEAWTVDPFKLTIDGDKLYGRGTTDCLGHVALMTTIFAQLGELKPELDTSLSCVFIASEEANGPGIGVDGLVADGKLDHCKPGPVIWVDCADSQPCIGTAGAITWALKAKGHRFHSGLPHKGINAIELGMAATERIQTKFYEKFPACQQERDYKFITSSTTKPTDESSSLAHARSFSVHAGEAANAVVDSPTVAGVLGIARITRTAAPPAACKAARRTPAAIDTSRVAPAAAAARTAPCTSAGFTAMTASLHETTESVIRTPANMPASSFRRSGETSQTTMESAFRPDRKRPCTSAAPMLPPPMTASIAGCSTTRTLLRRRKAAGKSEPQQIRELCFDGGEQRSDRSVEFAVVDRRQHQFADEKHRVLRAERVVRADETFVAPQQRFEHFCVVLFWVRHHVGLVLQGSLTESQPDGGELLGLAAQPHHPAIRLVGRALRAHDIGVLGVHGGKPLVDSSLHGGSTTIVEEVAHRVVSCRARGRARRTRPRRDACGVPHLATNTPSSVAPLVRS